MASKFFRFLAVISVILLNMLSSCKSIQKENLSKSSEYGSSKFESIGIQGDISVHTTFCKYQPKDYYCVVDIYDRDASEVVVVSTEHREPGAATIKSNPVCNTNSFQMNANKNSTNAGFIFMPASCREDVVITVSYKASLQSCFQLRGNDSPIERGYRNCSIKAPPGGSIIAIHEGSGPNESFESNNCNEFSDESDPTNIPAEHNATKVFTDRVGETTLGATIKVNNCGVMFRPVVQVVEEKGLNSLQSPHFFLECPAGTSLCGVPYVDNLVELTSTLRDGQSDENCKISNVFISGPKVVGSSQASVIFVNFEKVTGEVCKVTAKYSGSPKNFKTFRIWTDTNEKVESLSDNLGPDYKLSSMNKFHVPAYVQFDASSAPNFNSPTPSVVNTSNGIWIIESNNDNGKKILPGSIELPSGQVWEGIGAGQSECKTFATINTTSRIANFEVEKVDGPWPDVVADKPRPIDGVQDNKDGGINLRNPCAAFFVWELQ